MHADQRKVGKRGGAIPITDKVKCGNNLEVMMGINIRSTKLDSSLMDAVLLTTQPSLFQTADVVDGMRIHTPMSQSTTLINVLLK